MHKICLEQKLGIQKSGEYNTNDFITTPLSQLRQAKTHTTSVETFPKLVVENAISEGSDGGTQEILMAKQNMIKKLNTLKKSNHYFHKRYTSTGNSFMPKSSIGMSAISSAGGGFSSPKICKRKSDKNEDHINKLNNFIGMYQNVPALEPY